MANFQAIPPAYKLIVAQAICKTRGAIRQITACVGPFCSDASLSAKRVRVIRDKVLARSRFERCEKQHGRSNAFVTSLRCAKKEHLRKQSRLAASWKGEANPEKGFAKAPKRREAG